MHQVAPKSIRAWLKSYTRARGRIRSASAHSAAVETRRALLAVEDAAEDAPDVGIEDWSALSVGEGPHRAGRVASDPLHGPEALLVGGQPAAVAGNGLACDPVKVHRPDVVAEWVPRARDVGDVRRGQRFERRVAPQELLVLRDHPVHLRLLQHDLRDQHVVGVPCPSPGQVPLVAPVPAEKAFAEAPPRPSVQGQGDRAPAGGLPWHGPDYIDPPTGRRRDRVRGQRPV